MKQYFRTLCDPRPGGKYLPASCDAPRDMLRFDSRAVPGSLKGTVCQLVQLPTLGTTPVEFAEYFEAVLHEVSAALSAGVPMELVASALEPVRELVAQSALVRRLQTWPRGYQGDFETIGWIVGRRNTHPVGTLAHAAEQWALDCPPCEQHRNKVAVQARLIADVLDGNREARILIGACGPICDVLQASEHVLASSCRMVLNDSDPAAIRHAREA